MRVSVSDELKARVAFNLDIGANAKTRKPRLGENEETEPPGKPREQPASPTPAARTCQTSPLRSLQTSEDGPTTWPAGWPGPQGARGLATPSRCASRSKHLEDGAVSRSPAPRLTLRGPRGVGEREGPPFSSFT